MKERRGERNQCCTPLDFFKKPLTFHPHFLVVRGGCVCTRLMKREGATRKCKGKDLTYDMTREAIFRSSFFLLLLWTRVRRSREESAW